MEKVILRRTSRILHGHCWIFSNELTVSPKHFEPGSLVEVYDHKKTFLGIGYINPNSLIAIRLLTRLEEPIDAAFFGKRITAALDYRKRLDIGTDSFRAVFSEGDFLPGLIADKYGDCLVLQFLTLGMERQRETILEAFEELLAPSVIVLRNDSQSRTLEGLDLATEVIKGSLTPLPLIREGDLVLEVDAMQGQKTGFFLDQRENRLSLSRLAQPGTALDLFCYGGAWGLQLADKARNAVTFVDSSPTAIGQARANALRNNLEVHCTFIKADVFRFLEEEAAAGKTYTTVVLDPPAFVKSRLKIKEALRGYREINARALKLVARDGILATSSCSYHIEKTAFLDMLRDAAVDAGRTCRLIEYRSQGKDHPVLLSVPETEYLKCAFLAVA